MKKFSATSLSLIEREISITRRSAIRSLRSAKRKSVIWSSKGWKVRTLWNWIKNYRLEEAARALRRRSKDRYEGASLWKVLRVIDVSKRSTLKRTTRAGIQRYPLNRTFFSDKSNDYSSILCYCRNIQHRWRYKITKRKYGFARSWINYYWTFMVSRPVVVPRAIPQLLRPWDNIRSTNIYKRLVSYWKVRLFNVEAHANDIDPLEGGRKLW